MATQEEIYTRKEANAAAFDRLTEAEPVLVEVGRAIDLLPGMTPETVLTSGAPMEFDQYSGGQRSGIIGGALFEGLASGPEDAADKIRSAKINVGVCHDYSCVGSLAGIYTASMPVFRVTNTVSGNDGFCNFYEGESLKRLNYGVYDDDVRRGLLFIQDVIAPTIAAALKRADGAIALRPIMRRALHMGDELHSRNTAATLLFTRELFPYLLDIASDVPDDVARTLEFLKASDYFFLRLSMASGKCTADAAHGIASSSVVTAMTFSCKEFSIRVSGLGDEWFSASMPALDAELFEGFTEDDIEYMGGESPINETVGLGGFAQAAAFPLQAYQGGAPEDMVRMNLQMYEIVMGEHPEYKIPYLSYRGTPTGIEIHRVVETGIRPVMDIGVAGRGGGQIGAGILRAPLDCFEKAVDAYAARYGTVVT